MPALESVCPTVMKRFCARHMSRNFKKTYPGPLMNNLFWKVVNAYSEFSFRKAMTTLKNQAGLGVEQWFKDAGAHELWDRYRIQPDLCQDEVTTNFVESFNALLGNDRCKPVLTLLDGIRRVTMVRHGKRQELAENWDDNGICPKIADRLAEITTDARTCKVYNAGKGKLEIQDDQSLLPVSVADKTCACGRWQISGIPWKHTVRALISMDETPSKYVSEWYSVRKYKEAYGLTINLVGDSETWLDYDFPSIQPPKLKREVGRPARNRRREEGELEKHKRSNTVMCTRCKNFGHNARTCKGGPTAKQVKKNQVSNATTSSSQPPKKKKKKSTVASSSRVTRFSSQPVVISEPPTPNTRGAKGRQPHKPSLLEY